MTVGVVDRLEAIEVGERETARAGGAQRPGALAVQFARHHQAVVDAGQRVEIRRRPRERLLQPPGAGDERDRGVHDGVVGLGRHRAAGRRRADQGVGARVQVAVEGRQVAERRLVDEAGVLVAHEPGAEAAEIARRPASAAAAAPALALAAEQRPMPRLQPDHVIGERQVELAEDLGDGDGTGVVRRRRHRHPSACRRPAAVSAASRTGRRRGCGRCAWRRRARRRRSRAPCRRRSPHRATSRRRRR